jgi:hypothetical protein
MTKKFVCKFPLVSPTDVPGSKSLSNTSRTLLGQTAAMFSKCDYPSYLKLPQNSYKVAVSLNTMPFFLCLRPTAPTAWPRHCSKNPDIPTKRIQIIYTFHELPYQYLTGLKSCYCCRQDNMVDRHKRHKTLSFSFNVLQSRKKAVN